MRPTSVTFGLTKSLGNFNSARADATVEVGETGDADSAMLLACAIVKDALGVALSAEEADALKTDRTTEVKI